MPSHIATCSPDISLPRLRPANAIRPSSYRPLTFCELRRDFPRLRPFRDGYLSSSSQERQGSPNRATRLACVLPRYERGAQLEPLGLWRNEENEPPRLHYECSGRAAWPDREPTHRGLCR
jgi:hypothetical protein